MLLGVLAKDVFRVVHDVSFGEWHGFYSSAHKGA
jgi:hypothetical protein